MTSVNYMLMISKNHKKRAKIFSIKSFMLNNPSGTKRWYYGKKKKSC